jgi:hypothetical protein
VLKITNECYANHMSILSPSGPQLLSRERAVTLLQPYIDLLNRCIDEGWEAWKTDYAHKAHILDARARAANVYCEIAYRAEQEFSRVDGAVVRRRNGSLTIFLGEEITLRFKKIKRNGRCSNIMTQTQTLFLAQLQLPGMLGGTMLHAGYVLDSLQLDVIRKAVVCQLDQQVLWQIELKGPISSTAPIPAPAAPPAPTKPRFVAKDQPAKPAAGKA